MDVVDSSSSSAGLSLKSPVDEEAEDGTDDGAEEGEEEEVWRVMGELDSVRWINRGLPGGMMLI